MGGGLAGSEAAWQLAEAGVDVVIAEMRPVRPTPVHRTDRLAELVCSNSLRGDSPSNAVGLLKREMAELGLADHPLRAGQRRFRRAARWRSIATGSPSW